MTGADSDPNDDSFAAMLCVALDSTDDRRVQLMTLLALMQMDVDREESLARLRRQGIPPVMRL